MKRPIDIAFTDSVRRAQSRYGAREHGQRLEDSGRWQAELTPDLKAFIEARDSFYLATASADGRPYIQHRGGLPGFLKVLDDKTLGFADYPGNRQYITAGNLDENDRAFIFLMDYARRRRVKLWGRAAVIDDAPELLAKLHLAAMPKAPERAIRFRIETWDVNCQQYIVRRYTEDDIAKVVAPLEARIEALEAELAKARGRQG
ncbi:MAG: pyridoxamine 5'-phosphate oxidase family protein [Alphaproteobacteria bacterium]|jgi:hypothetical protein|nr:pyridoxamine 5'-phosphate oxidase family protein [Alphaproteobacteria bacterium]